MRSTKTKKKVIQPAKITCEVITEEKASFYNEFNPNGWGIGYQAIKISGLPHKMTIFKNGKPATTIRIEPDGSIMIFSFEGTYNLPGMRSVDLKCEPPWSR